MNQPDTYRITPATLDLVTDYLAKRPWAEVNHILVALNTEARPQIEAANPSPSPVTPPSAT